MACVNCAFHLWHTGYDKEEALDPRRYHCEVDSQSNNKGEYARTTIAPKYTMRNLAMLSLVIITIVMCINKDEANPKKSGKALHEGARRSYSQM